MVNKHRQSQLYKFAAVKTATKAFWIKLQMYRTLAIKLCCLDCSFAVYLLPLQSSSERCISCFLLGIGLPNFDCPIIHLMISSAGVALLGHRQLFPLTTLFANSFLCRFFSSRCFVFWHLVFSLWFCPFFCCSSFSFSISFTLLFVLPFFASFSGLPSSGLFLLTSVLPSTHSFFAASCFFIAARNFSNFSKVVSEVDFSDAPGIDACTVTSSWLLSKVSNAFSNSGSTVHSCSCTEPSQIAATGLLSLRACKHIILSIFRARLVKRSGIDLITSMIPSGHAAGILGCWDSQN